MYWLQFGTRVFSRVTGIMIRRRREAAFAERYLSELERAIGGRLRDEARRKIIVSYSIYVPMIVQSFNGLRGRGVSDGERERMLLYFICSTTFDDFTDRGELTAAELFHIAYTPETFPDRRAEEKIFIHAHTTLLEFVREKDAYAEASRGLYDAQVASAEQTDPAVEDEALHRMTIGKGAYAVLLSSFYLDDAISPAERDTWFRLGGIIQLTNDLFDIWKDLQASVHTLPTRMRDAHAFHDFFDGMTGELENGVSALPFTTARKQRFLLDMMAICSFGEYAIHRLQTVQGALPQLPPLAELPRKSLIVDMEKPGSIWHCMRFTWRRCMQWRKLRLTALLCCLLLPFFQQAQAQDASQLLREIAAEQVEKDGFYHAGMFPSMRHYGRPDGKMKEDNNIFFTGLIAFTLSGLQDQFHGADSILCRRMLDNARTAFPHFRRRPDRPVYNFWKTNPDVVFPNSRFLGLFKKWHSLPDDIDDTVILLMAMQADKDTALVVKSLMEQHANTVRYRIRNTFPAYRNIPAYSTWFGSNMPIDFDFCVLTNALYFTHASGIAGGAADDATVALLDSFLTHRQHLTHARYISPHYARPPVLMYHIARLMGNFSIPPLERHRAQLIADANAMFRQSETSPMDRIMLATSLLWLGGEAPSTVSSHAADDRDFVFFVAGFNSLLPDPWKKMFTGHHLVTYYYKCPAYNKALVLQYLLLRDRAKH